MIIITVALLFIINAITLTKADETTPQPKVISAAQYCIGCKETVDNFAKYTLDRIRQMDDPLFKDKEFDVVESLNSFCRSPYFEDYEFFVKGTCMKLFGYIPKEKTDHRFDFLTKFGGDGGIATPQLKTRRSIYEKRREVSFTYMLKVLLTATAATIEYIVR